MTATSQEQRAQRIRQPTRGTGGQPAQGIAGDLREVARRFPDKPAIIYPTGNDRRPARVRGTPRARAAAPRYETLTFRDVDELSEAYAAGLHRAGIGKGTKTILMLRPDPQLYLVLFGLLKLGAVPVIVDPGMGVRRMLHCFRSVGAEAFIGIPLAHVIRVLSPRTFRGLRVLVTAGRRWFWRGHTLRRLAADPGSADAPVAGPAVTVTAGDPLSIAFTTGSTGPAKGVESTHAMLAATVAEVAALTRQAGGHPDAEVCLVTLPMFGVLHLLLGATVVLPPIDPTRVADAEPEVIAEAIARFTVTSMFASPALLGPFGRHLAATGRRLPSLRRVYAGGAPVSEDIVATMHEVLGGEPGRFHVTYGATEALPIASIDSAEILDTTLARTRTGSGICAGRPVDSVDVRIVRITDAPIPHWSGDVELPAGQIGEITIAGPIVSRHYHANDAADAAGKIRDGHRAWHRTGDLGYLDEAGRLWFCGRKAHRVTTSAGLMFSVQSEHVFNAHPQVYRTALVGVGEPGRQRPVLCVETRPGVPAAERRRLTAELLEVAGQHEATRGITQVLFHPRFPVDIRHNAKIGREELAVWAAARLRTADRRDGRNRWRRLLPRVVPVAGWLYLLYGILRPFHHPVLAALFWIDAFASVVVHTAQIPAAVRRARPLGYGTGRTALLTLLFGATWWRTLPAQQREAG